LACMLALPKDGTITHVGFLITATAGTPPAYNVGICTLDSSGRPNTTAYGGSTHASYAPTSTGWKWAALGVNATAAAGDFVALRIYPTGSAPDGSNNISVCRNPVAGTGTQLSFATSWTVLANTAIGAMAVKYSDNTIFGNAITSADIHVQLRSDTTPDEAGCKFQVPLAMTVRGALLGVDASWGSAATADVVLYDNANNVLATTSIADKDYVDDNSYINVWFDAVNLSPSTNYRLTVKPGVAGATGTVFIQRYQFESTAARDSWPPGDGLWQYTYRTDAGAWTDVSTDLSYMGLWVTDISGTVVGSAGGEFAYVG
jgi:hypothetical protein